MRSMLTIPAVLVVLWTASACAVAGELFVDNLNGDDRLSGTAAIYAPGGIGPVRTIQKALQRAVAGDRIVLAATGHPYRESLTLMGRHNSGGDFGPLVIEGRGAILDGSAPVRPDAWENYRGPVFRFAPPRLEFQQLFLAGRPASRVPSRSAADEPPLLQPLQWCLHQGHVYFRVEPDKLPDQYPLSYADKPVGITLYRVRDVVIQDLTVQGFQLDGINAFNSAAHVTLQRLTCRGNGRSGIAVGGACSVEVNECLVGNNGEAQLLTAAWSETSIHNGELLSNTAPAWVSQGGRVYLDGKPIEGGLDGFKPAASATNAARPTDGK